MKKKVVKITWIDSCDDERTWFSMSDPGELIVITTVGILIKKTKDMVTIAHSIHNDRICGVLYIPRGCVKNIEYLTEIKDLRKED